jgi:hypothetical protein
MGTYGDLINVHIEARVRAQCFDVFTASPNDCLCRADGYQQLDSGASLLHIQITAAKTP